MRRLLLLGLGLVLLLSAGAALASGEGGGGLEIPRWVIAAGGGRSEVGNVALTGTIGQPVVGTGSARRLEVCSGFWAGPCGYQATLKLTRVYLPLVLRDYP